jgi:hypothetical protein
MAAAAKYRDDMSGNLVLGGTSTAYTVTTNQVVTALNSTTDGFAFRARMNVTNGANATIAVDGLTAKPIYAAASGAMPAGCLAINGLYAFTYDSTLDAWVAQLGPHQNPANDLIAPATTAMLFFQTAAPTGWVKNTSLDNGTIRMVSGAVGADGGTANFTDVFAARTISQANLPSVNFVIPSNAVVTDTSMSHPNQGSASGAGGGPSFLLPTADLTVTKGSVNVPSGGSGTAMGFAVKYAEAIRAAKA